MEQKTKLKVSWPKVKLIDITELIMGQSPPGTSYNFENKGIPLLNGAADFEGNKIVVKQHTTKPTKLSKKGDLIFCIRATIGKTTLSNGEYCLGRGVAALRAKGDKADIHFLKRVLDNELDNLVLQGSTIKGVRKEDLEEIEILLPPLQVQKHIVSILEKAESLKQKRENADKLTKDYLQSVFYEMFDTYLKDKNKFKKITEFVENSKNSIKAGPFGSSLKKECYAKKGFKIYGQEQVIKDDLNFGNYYISKEKYEELENYKVKEGDILISLVGTYGKISIVPKSYQQGIINPRLMKITLDKKKMNPIFFKFVFNSPIIKIELENVSHGGTMDILNVGLIKKIGFPLPPLNLQNDFASIVEQVEKLKEEQIKSKEEINVMFDSLMKQAFNGELMR